MAENRPASAGYRPIKSKTTAYGSTDDNFFHQSASFLSEDGGHPDDSGEHGQKPRPRFRKKGDDERPLMGDADTQFHVDDDSPQIKLLPEHQQSLHRQPQPYDAAQQTQHGQQEQQQIQQGQQAPLGQQQQIQQGQQAPLGQQQQIQQIRPGQEQQQQIEQDQPIPLGQEQQIQAPVQQLELIQPPHQREKLCKIFDICLIGVPAALLLACIGLLIYAGYMGNHVQLNDDIWFSSTENYSLNDHHLHRYASEVCIKELSQEHQDDLDNYQVTVMLAKKPCKYAPLKKTLRKINKSFTSDSSQNARLYFYWISKTSVSFEVNITSDTKVGHLTVYILRTESQEKECGHHSKPTGNDYFVFNFDGNSTSNVNCTQENNTNVCWSSAVVISKTQHYHVCMLFSSGSIKEDVSYNVLANEVTYDLSDTCESVQCHLNESNCCISYDSFFESSCVFLKNSAIGNDNQAVELPVPLTITSKKRWTAVKYLAIPTSVSFLLCVAASVYVIIKWRYRKMHPNQGDYMRLTDAARTCLCS